MQMALRNRIKEFINQKKITPYQFMKATRLAQGTAYSLCSEPGKIPGPKVLQKICEAYRVQPGDLLEWVEDKQPSKLTPG
jgi:DNA-binding Xre family transcriptional regulator